MNRHYYSIAINYRKNDFEQKMLLNLNKVLWSESLKCCDYEEKDKENEDKIDNYVGKLGVSLTI